MDQLRIVLEFEGIKILSSQHCHDHPVTFPDLLAAMQKGAADMSKDAFSILKHVKNIYGLLSDPGGETPEVQDIRREKRLLMSFSNLVNRFMSFHVHSFTLLIYFSCYLLLPDSI